jgi:hypothetical protein
LAPCKKVTVLNFSSDNLLGRMVGWAKAELSHHHLALAETAAAVVLAIATLSVTGAATSAHEPAPAPSISSLSSYELQRVSTGMSGYAVTLAERLARGEQGWAPGGVGGWEVFNLAPPDFLPSRLSAEEARHLNGLIVPTASEIRPMRAFLLSPLDGDFALARDCLAQAIYYEAALEGEAGHRAVAQVVLNRVQSPAYPNTVCGVVYQGSERLTGCQFTFTCDGSRALAPVAEYWRKAVQVADDALSGYVYAPVGTATHYHADYVFPYWAITLVKLDRIGAHIFYRMRGPNGAPEIFTAQYAGGEDRIPLSVLRGGDTLTPDAPPVADEALEAVQPRPDQKLVTLTVGGETKTYAVGATSGAADAVQTGPPEEPAGPSVVTGVLTPSRRAPTADEVRAINARLLEFQSKQGDTSPDYVPPGG